MKSSNIAAFVTLLLFGFPIIGQPNSDNIGIIKSVSGNALIVRQAETLQADINTRIQKGDKLKTAADGKMGIIFEDDTVISMGPDSQLAIEDFLFQPDEKKMSFIARIFYGTISFLSGQIAKLAPDLVNIETPDATIGMRGTHVLVKVE